MSGWVWVVVLNGITAAAYLGIVLFIVRGLMRTGQLRNNRLAVATAAIFLTCAAHHLVHAVHLWTGFDGHASHLAAGSGGGMLDAMRESMGGTLDVAVTASTALAGVIYLGMRRFYGPLLRSPSMFDDASEARYRQLAANLPHTSVLVVDCDLRFVLVEGAGLVAEGYDPRRMEGSCSETRCRRKPSRCSSRITWRPWRVRRFRSIPSVLERERSFRSKRGRCAMIRAG